jgi:hypothetical protein
MMTLRRCGHRLLLITFSLLASTPLACAWGCKGHQVVALIAESHMTPHAREVALSILNAAPIDPNLPRYCGPSGLDPFADGSTWPDDIRKIRPETAPWHFIDIPRGAPKSDLARYCAPVTGCVTSALTEQIRILRDPSAGAEAKADALRFVIHFVGDIHQPLHAITNNDLGGNCVPVTFFGRAPAESSPGSGVFNPNLHEVWDVEIIEHFSPGQSSSQVANDLDQEFGARIPAWQKQPADFAAWAWESHQLAESVAYGRLPHRLPIEPPRPMTSCPASNSPAAYAKILRIDENLADDYQNAAAPVVQEQLAKAGARLAAILNSLWH